MTIDNTPAIRSFVAERRKGVIGASEFGTLTIAQHAVLQELDMILKLCDELALVKNQTPKGNDFRTISDMDFSP